MKLTNAVGCLEALAQETRLSLYRALVQAGPEGLAAGAIAQAVQTPASTLSFHLKALTAAGLIHARQDGRFIYYATDYTAMSELVAFLTENCCKGMPGAQMARIGRAVASCCAPGKALPKERKSA
jgi:ArsR family transcriptional regulator, arsenate/arsenite/antimonite-responsive transcriptional repressor